MGSIDAWTTEITAALESWSVLSRAKGIQAAHNEHQAVRMALASWSQEAPYAGVPWPQAVLRCIKAAQGSGAKFGESPKYAIKIIGGLLSAWREGTPPEPPPTALNWSSVQHTDDGAAQAGFEDAMKRINARKVKA